MTYQVGQIIFVVLNKKTQVYPMMVVEEIVKRTLHSEDINYVLQGGSDSNSTVLLDQVDGEIFESADEAKYVLISRATTQIEKMVDLATKRAKEWYEKTTDTSKHEIEATTLSDQENASIKITLPDGTIANLKTG